MKLVFFSGGDYKENKKLNRELFRLSGKKNPSMVYVPSRNDEHEAYFNEWKRFYKKLGITDFTYLPLRKGLSQKKKDKAFSADIIFLSGGNTFTFLRNLKRSGLEVHFQNFIARGGVLAGMSAGSILMTPSIHMAQVPSFDSDENEVRMKEHEWDALNFVNFEFSPHYEGLPIEDEELKVYSKQSPRPIYSCEDGSGLIVENNKILRLGNVYRFYKGQKVKVKESAWAHQ